MMVNRIFPFVIRKKIMQITFDCTLQNVEAMSTIAAILNGQPVDQEAVKRAINLLEEKLNGNRIPSHLSLTGKTPVINAFPIRIANTLMRNKVNFVEEIDLSNLHSFKGLGDNSIQLIKDFIEKGVAPETPISDSTKSGGQWVCLSDRYTKEQIDSLDRKIFDFHLVYHDGRPHMNPSHLSPELLDYLVLATQTRKQPERMQAFVKAHFLERQSIAKSAELIGITANHARTKCTRFERQINLYVRRLAEKFSSHD